jgi:hypothetical protein
MTQPMPHISALRHESAPFSARTSSGAIQNGDPKPSLTDLNEKGSPFDRSSVAGGSSTIVVSGKANAPRGLHRFVLVFLLRNNAFSKRLLLNRSLGRPEVRDLDSATLIVRQ